MTRQSVSIALTGSGGAGVMTAGQALLDAAARAGWYGLMGRSLGPQIRGGESAALLRFSTRPVQVSDDVYDVLVACDWGNIDRFAGELPLASDSLIICDPAQGAVPEIMVRTGARVIEAPLKELAGSVPGGRVNSVVMGLAAKLIGLPFDSLETVLAAALEKKGPTALESTMAAATAGADFAAGLSRDIMRADAFTLAPPAPLDGPRWVMTGNEATGLGVLRGGVRFVAAYPITPATEILEWLADALPRVGGALVQCEDELASINMALGGSFAGVPSMTATSGPGLSLMTESIGLGVAAEVPVVVVNVMRGGPSTGIPTKSEQADLNIALYGLHGDAPHVVTAPNSIEDCLFTAQWSVHLAEAMQVPVLMLSDQAMGQSRMVLDRPAEVPFTAERRLPEGDITGYRRHALTPDGISPMAVPGMRGGEYVADGLEHAVSGRPSTKGSDHLEQLDKRKRKLELFDYGDHWADIEGTGEIAVITFGSVTGAAREAATRLRTRTGQAIRLISLRLIAPTRPERMAKAMEGVKTALVVEQNHSGQLYRYLKGHYDFSARIVPFHRPGPLNLRPREIEDALARLTGAPAEAPA